MGNVFACTIQIPSRSVCLSLCTLFRSIQLYVYLNIFVYTICYMKDHDIHHINIKNTCICARTYASEVYKVQHSKQCIRLLELRCAS